MNIEAIVAYDCNKGISKDGGMPWNIKDEIMEQMSFVRSWGGKFVRFIPQVDIN